MDAFARAFVAPTVGDRDRDAAWDPVLFHRLGEAARAALADGPTLAAALRAIGAAGDAGLALAWASHVVGACLPLARLGTPAHTALLDALVAGRRVGAFAHAEPPDDGGTRAILEGDRWTLSGRKVAVVNAGVADVLVVTAATGPDAVSAFLVPGYAPGVRVRRRDTPGLRTAVVGDIELRGVVVHTSARLGEEGAALREVVAPALRWGRACRYAAWAGLLRALLDDTVDRVRAPDARALAADQEVRAALADARIRVELLDRLLARSAARVAEVGAAAERDVAVGALFATDALADVVRVLVRVQGGAALEAGSLAERACRDAVSFAALTEPREALRSAVADALLPR